MKSVPLVDLKAQYRSIQEEINQAIFNCIEQGRFIGGQPVKLFEEELARFCNIPFAAGCGNGTDALEISLKILGIGKGDEVIIPAMTFMATAEAVVNAGAEVKICDIKKGTYLLDPDEIENNISSKTKAIIAVHLYGQMAEMDKIAAIAKKHSLYLIEDSAQAIGAAFNSLGPGHYGDIATFSFFPGKNLGAYGDAGAMVTKDKDFYLEFKKVANHGRLSKFGHDKIGRNSRLDTLQASILSVKLKYLSEWTKLRQAHAGYYTECLNETENIVLPESHNLAKHVFHLYVIKVEQGQRDDLLSELKNSGIEAGIHYPQAIHEIQAFEYLGYNNDEFPEASDLSRRCISLPMYPELSKADIDLITDIIRNFIV